MQFRQSLAIIALFVLPFAQPLLGQARNTPSHSQPSNALGSSLDTEPIPFFHVTAYLYAYRQFNNSRSLPNRGGLGVGIDFDFSFTNRLGLMAQLQYTQDHYLGFYVPLYFSPRVIVYQNQHFRTLIHLGLGPAYGIGADRSRPPYLAINGGLRIELGGHSKGAKFSFGSSYSQPDAAGSEALHYINFLFGIRF